jgi:hypothetical protein
MFGVETWAGAVSMFCVNGILPFTYILQTGAPSSPCTPVDPIHLLVFVLRLIQ